MKTNNFQLTIIIPVYNEVNRILSTIYKVEVYIYEKKISTEILIIDDGSTDETLELLIKIKKIYPNIKIIHYDKNRGKGFAVKLGVSKAVGELILVADADNSVDIKNLGKFIQEIINGFDIVCASIYLEKSKVLDKNKLRRIASEFGILLIKKVLNLEISDTQRGFKLFKNDAAKNIFKKISRNRFSYDVEIFLVAKRNNYKIKELPVVWINYPGSKVEWWDYFRSFWDLVVIKYREIIGKY